MNRQQTIAELEQLYDQDQRREFRLSLQENTKNKEIELSFFNHFRKFETDVDEMDQVDSVAFLEYKKIKDQEKAQQVSHINAIKQAIRYQKFFLTWERRQTDLGKQGSTPATRFRVDQIKKFKQELELLLETSPEAWDVYYEEQWLNDIKCRATQKLVPVPYVSNTKQKIIQSLEVSQPVYLVGHLGSGKTQLAIEAAVDFTIQNKIQATLETEMDTWFMLNQDCSEQEAMKVFNEKYQYLSHYYEDILVHGTKEEIAAIQPLFISGSHNLTYEDMFVEKTLSLEQQFTHDSFSDYLNVMIEDYREWIKEHENVIQHVTQDEALQLKVQIWKSFSDLLIAKNNTFGTTVKKIEREILIAIKEGRPVIVDELNTIAMQNLIALNDLLQRHVGETAYITGIGPVTIQPGFAFIGTGNLSTQLINYEGTNQLNPAFQSRFVTIEYNYVPQQLNGTLLEQKDPVENELFRVMLSRLAQDSGGIALPNMERNLNELFQLAQLSRLTQNVFMGKWQGEGADEQFTSVELRESVLSIRNIIHVLDQWNSGEEMDLSQALWEGFISSITYPDDQNYILAQAVRFGFFASDEGWNIQAKATGSATTTYQDIRTTVYNYERQKMEYRSIGDVMHLIFGERPQRQKNYPQLEEFIFEKQHTEANLSRKEYEEMNQRLSQLEYLDWLQSQVAQEEE